ncbi:hypothetical protein FS837_008731 [Tulasnella sp. UAMH 9824]|nr:hypothetical protein FS837_008731 [Tulasnella sp. UAMH 9824]
MTVDLFQQVDPSGLNPKYRYVEKDPEVEKEPEVKKETLGVDIGGNIMEAWRTSTLPLNIKPKASTFSSEETKPIKKEEEEAPVYPPQATEPEGPLVLNVCGICKGYYRPAENPLVSTLASPSSFKSPYFDPNQASPFPFGLDLNCPGMHGSCIDCMEKHIINQLKINHRMAFPIRCPACIREEEDQDIDCDDRPTKGFVWEVHDALAEKILGHKSMELWRERKEQERQLYLSLNQPRIIQNFDENHALIESIIVLKVVEPELDPPKITPASLQSGAIWTTGRDLEADRASNLASCKICMESTFIVTYPAIASQIAPRRAGRFPPYGLELECPDSHAFCAPCLTKYVNECMGNVQRSSKVMCPACAGDMAAAVSGESDDWEEGKEITNEVVGKFLDELGLAKWGVWKARLAARSNRTFVCPNADCGKDLEIQEPKPEYDRGQCAECETKVCLECRAMFHDGLSCAENKALIAPEDKLFYSFAKKRLMRRCPQCQMVVAKDPGGCNRVTCVCGYQFCWRCGGLYRSVKTDFQGCNGLCPEWVEDKTLLPVESEARASSSYSMEK